MNYQKRFPDLVQFLGGYFHNVWPELHPPKDDQPRYTAVLDHFAKQESRALIKDTITELEQLIQLKLNESELRRVVTRELRGNIYPPGMGMTYQEWLEDVHRILTEKVK